MHELLHVATEAGWAEARAAGAIACVQGGFIHLCTADQLGFVLGRHFAGRSGLVLLRVDGTGLDIRWERSEADLPPFPHLYGPLPAGSVRSVEKL